MKREINFSIVPDWLQLESVSNKVYEFFNSCDVDPDSVDKFAMITCELVENSVKYGEFRNGHQKIDILVKIKDNKIFILVKNPVGKISTPYLRELDKTIQRVRAYQDPYQAYIERVKEISMEPFENDKSGLGIVRIANEGRAVIDFIINEENILAVSAVSTIK